MSVGRNNILICSDYRAVIPSISSIYAEGFSQSYPQSNRRADFRDATASRRINGNTIEKVGLRAAGLAYFAPRLRLIETAEISLPGDWIEIDCWLLWVLTASIAEKIGLLARRLI